ncbi:MAG TPA: hypothetical protein VNB54_12295, partial [Alphaproteobacteria bacterium]|nr:hypothetical protein [Alphaproteobacteria bacterium]
SIYASQIAIQSFFGCIIRASDLKTCPTVVVHRIAAFARCQRQRQNVDGQALRWRLRTPVARGLSENCFPDSLK